MAVREAGRTVRAPWANARTGFGLALFLVSLASGWHLLAATERGVQVWAASTDLPAGVALREDDVVAVATELGPGQLTAYLGPHLDLEGLELTRPAQKGELLAASFVAPEGSGPGGRSMTVPVTADHAVGGKLVPGDRVDVYATLTGGGASARTSLVVAEAQILDLVVADGLMVDGGALTGLTLDVDETDAARLAFALRNAEIDIVKVRGHGPPPSVASASARDL